MSKTNHTTRSFFESNVDRITKQVFDKQESFVVEAESGKRLLIKPTEDDSWVEVPLDLEPEVFSGLARIAHERNITFNELFCEIMQWFIDRPQDLKKAVVQYKKSLKKPLKKSRK